MNLPEIPAIQNIQIRMQEIESRFLGKREPQTFAEALASEREKMEVAPSSTFPAREDKPNLNNTGIQALIEGVSQKKGLDPNLVKAVVRAESGFSPEAVSKKGAMGLMQLMPETAKSLGVEDPFDPLQNLEGGTSYLRSMIQQFGSLDKGLAAYNAGPGAVKKYNGVPPYSETLGYVEKVKKYYEGYLGSDFTKGRF